MSNKLSDKSGRKDLPHNPSQGYWLGDCLPSNALSPITLASSLGSASFCSPTPAISASHRANNLPFSGLPNLANHHLAASIDRLDPSVTTTAVKIQETCPDWARPTSSQTNEGARPVLLRSASFLISNSHPCQMVADKELTPFRSHEEESGAGGNCVCKTVAPGLETSADCVKWKDFTGRRQRRRASEASSVASQRAIKAATTGLQAMND
ncbi:unnamed protein product [Protopolystoma xenopodis]|uniref:Uncharacterized protein n=1 Tax=Protopolystoma xenopodis TaxID=117903 RepID=A0A3S5CN76_9PLAT|nr:unnamed protein product [Protopolystoma xenopodis]